MLPAIFGLTGLALTDAERSFFRSADPLGFILFARNVADRAQLRALTDELRSLTGRDDLPILVDQEGGRVARLGPPDWLIYPAASDLAKGFHEDPTRTVRLVEINFEALALDLFEVGISVNTAPVLDVLTDITHQVIGDRAFGAEGMQVARLGRACLNGLRLGGVAGVIKHIPGHGRASLDSHEALPVVHTMDRQLDRDLLPFMQLADAPMAMTAHVKYTAWDSDNCATLSRSVIHEVIRSRIGFDGLLMTDDLDMKALKGSVPELAVEAIAAGNDVVLNCWAKMEDMEGIASALPSATPKCLERLQAAMRGLSPVVSRATISERQIALLDERDRLMQS
jgi:beta-N-acetylhexosaminidase